VIKVVLNQQGLYAVKKLAEQNIQTNVTLVFSTMQALLAAKAGATYVSPFLGRVDDIGSSGIELIENIRTVFENYDLGTKILSASIRHTQHVQDVALAGTDCITMPPKLFDALLKHPLTDLGIKQFEKDAAVFENA
jgi:transaldolase